MSAAGAEALALDLEADTFREPKANLFERMVVLFGGEVFPGRHKRMGAACRNIAPLSWTHGRRWVSGPSWLHNVGSAYDLARAVCASGEVGLKHWRYADIAGETALVTLSFDSSAIGEPFTVEGRHADRPEMALCAAAVRAWGRLHP